MTMIDPAVGCLGAAAGALFTYAFGLADPAVMLALVAGVAALALAYALARMYLHDQHHNHVPRGYSDAKFVPEPVASHRAAPNRDGFSRKKIPKDLDVIVIGSGIGGLATAGLLARAGKRVLVLEQHYIAGGCTHCFEEHGYQAQIYTESMQGALFRRSSKK